EEGRALLEVAGLDLHAVDAIALVEQLEGWPAGLYLHALANRDSPPGTTRSLEDTESFVAEYFREEIFASTSPEVVDFMIRTSLLDRMTGPLCDAVLERSGSLVVLDELVRSNRFVVPMDVHREWFRYHHLFRALLQEELARRTTDLAETLHLRASEWFEAHGDVDSAIHHAHAAGDRSHVATLIWCSTHQYVGSGRAPTVKRWLELFSSDEISTDAALSLTAAWCALTAGDPGELIAWTDFAESACGNNVLPDGTSRRAMVALLRALDGRDGLSQMRSDAADANVLDRPESPFRSIAFLLEGEASRLLDDVPHARDCFTRAIAHGSILTPALHAQGLASMSVLAADSDEWQQAEVLSRRALDVVDAYELHDCPDMSRVFSIAALTAARTGATTKAREHAKRAAALMVAMHGIAPWNAIEARILLGRFSISVGDPAHARQILSEAEHELHNYPDSGSLPDRLNAANQQLAISELPISISVQPLTAAELRVLHYLPTHLTFAQIAEELFVSRSTVKTQAVAVYRKLEVSSRNEAVDRARDLGIVLA
ncbi:MAG: LuxR C-terminal-related transcriptional regulator, partial [Acidimicrobiia bacterium]|nr:LuxR C-terminal-related transcriptional regulator [Acidimicrobiia bacterium]